MVTGNNSISRLAEIALAIVDASGLESVCTALENGRLSQESTAATRAAIAEGNTTLESHIRSLQETWTFMGVDISSQALAFALRTGVASVQVYREQVPITQVVWTGPKVEGSFLRATREVVREILHSAQKELLVVGYWIAARDDGEGIIEEIITSLADAVTRHVDVNVIVDERMRSDGRDNRHVLASAWPSGISFPKILTWHLPPSDQYLKLHAKVLVADHYDALVTSANLTSYAMDHNMEMGVRIVGHPADTIVKHFNLLEGIGILEPYDDERCLS